MNDAVYACLTDYDQVYLCLAESRRKAMAKFRADDWASDAMRADGFKVGKIDEVLAGTCWDIELLARDARSGYSGRLIGADRR